MKYGLLISAVILKADIVWGYVTANRCTTLGFLFKRVTVLRYFGIHFTLASAEKLRKICFFLVF